MGIRFLSSKLWAGAVICHCILVVQIWRDKVENKSLLHNRQKWQNTYVENLFINAAVYHLWHFIVFFTHCACISTFEHHLLQWLLNSCNSSTVQLVSNETRYGSSLFFLEKLQLVGSRAYVRVEKYANKNNFGQILHLLLHGTEQLVLTFMRP